MQQARLLVILIVTLFLQFGTSTLEAGVHQCVHATRKLGKNGDGSTETSCMHCDPALPECFYDCQPLIDQMYVACDGVCLPDGYFFDASFTLAGCWDDVKPDVKIGVERCGCNSAFSLLKNLRWNYTIGISIILVLALLII